MISIAKMGCYCFGSGCATKLIALDGVGFGAGGAAAAACFAAARSLRLRLATRTDQAACSGHSRPRAKALALAVASRSIVTAWTSCAAFTAVMRCLVVNGAAGVALRRRSRSRVPAVVNAPWWMAQIAARASQGLIFQNCTNPGKPHWTVSVVDPVQRIGKIRTHRILEVVERLAKSVQRQAQCGPVRQMTVAVVPPNYRFGPRRVVALH